MRALRPVAAVCWRDLLVISRRRSMAVAIAIHVVLLASFLLAWSGAFLVPLIPGATFYEQTRMVQSALVSAILPWSVCRFASAEHPKLWMIRSLATGLSPSRVFDAHAAALAIFAAILVGSGLPLMLLAQQMSSVTVSRVFADCCSLWLFALAVTTMTLSIASSVRGAVVAWLLSSAAAVVIRGLMPSSGTPASALLAIAIIVATLTLAEYTDPSVMLGTQRT
jgi:hypothetical protein